ncbi:MAG: hypothetical protein IJZ36_03035 [Bacilli bacterium]|nr:hypothetical protein [Bacilli bacterium]
MINDNTLSNYKGGISAAFINSIIRGVTFLFELGKSLGTSIRRNLSKSICPL